MAMSGGGDKTTFYISVLLCVFAGSFQYGYNISSVNGPAENIKDDLYSAFESGKAVYQIGEDGLALENPVATCPNASSIADCGPCKEEITCKSDFILEADRQLYITREDQYSYAVALFTVGGIVGSFSVKPVVSHFGRKKGQLVNMVISLGASVLFVGAKYYNSHICLVVARILIGLFSGLATGICPMYIIEMSAQEDRGWIGVLNQLLITIGILVAQIVALSSTMRDSWGIYMALTGVPAIIWIALMGLSYESPRYLYLEKNDAANATKVLKKVRGTEDVEDELDEMKAEHEKSLSEENMSIGALFTSKDVRWQLISIAAMMIAQQMSGINAVFFYTNKIFESAGFTNETSTKISVLIGALNVAMTFVSMSLMEKAGRRSLMVYGYGIMVVFCVLLAVALKSLHIGTWVSYVSILCVMGYIVGFAIGPGPVPWIWATEFFKQSARAAGASMGCVICWVCTFIVGKFFPIAEAKLGPYVFIFFGIVSLMAFLYCLKITPETKGKSFEEIQVYFAKLNGVEISDEEMKLADNRADD